MFHPIHLEGESGVGMGNERYAYALGRVTHDVLGGEALVIEEASGAYFSMSGPSAAVWMAIGLGRSLDEIAEAVASHHAADLGLVREAVEPFVKELLAEGLVVITDSEHEPPSLDAVPAGEWSELTLLKFTDMRDLLLFDPIHEVDTTGWPNVER
jgi:hypothetical protein